MSTPSFFPGGKGRIILAPCHKPTVGVRTTEDWSMMTEEDIQPTIDIDPAGLLKGVPMLILAGGKASRLAELSLNQPKSLIDIGGEPFISHQLKLLRRQGITRVLLLIGHLGDQIKEFVGDGRKFDIDVTYHEDGPKLLGTGGAVKGALKELPDEFAVMYGDSYLDVAIVPIYSYFKQIPGKALMTVLENNDNWQPSNVQLDADTRQITASSKTDRTDSMHHIDFGLSFFRKSAFDAIKRKKSFDLAAVFADLAGKGELYGYEVNRRFYDIGTPAALMETRAYLSQAQLW